MGLTRAVLREVTDNRVLVGILLSQICTHSHRTEQSVLQATDSVCHPAENQILEQRGQRPAGAWYKIRKAKTQEAVGRFFMLRAGDLHVVPELEEGRKGGKGRRKYQAAYLNLKFFILEKKKRTSGIHSPQKPAANQLLNRTAPATTMMTKWGRCLMEG